MMPARDGRVIPLTQQRSKTCSMHAKTRMARASRIIPEPCRLQICKLCSHIPKKPVLPTLRSWTSRRLCWRPAICSIWYLQALAGWSGLGKPKIMPKSWKETHMKPGWMRQLVFRLNTLILHCCQGQVNLIYHMSSSICEIVRTGRRNQRTARMDSTVCAKSHAELWSAQSSCTGHTYNVYPQPNNPAIDLYTHIWKWKEFYETRLLGRKLQPDDYIFPSFGVNGLVAHPHVPISSDLIQKRINEWTAVAGIRGAGHFMTHCFRCGGAQYHFMFAPIGQRWTLAWICWWGGWAIGEHVCISFALLWKANVCGSSVIH